MYAQHAGRAQLLVARSEAAAAAVPERSLDLVFVDANHSYESVRADIRVWRSKVRCGGVVAGHDFAPAFEGVLRAVLEEASAAHADVHVAAWTWWYFRRCDDEATAAPL